MRLVDRIAQSDQECFASDARGNFHRVPGPGAAADDLGICAVRYIIDPTASSQCADLLKRERELFDPANPMLRAIAPLFWMEWFQDEFADDHCGDRQRLGLLVEASPDGRRGMVRYFFETLTRAVGASPLRLEFDLDQPPRADPTRDRYRLTHGEMEHVDVLLRHSVLCIDEKWRPAVASCTPAERRDFVASHANSMWLTFPLMLAFGALLGDGRVLSERRSDLEKVNSARRKNGKRLLLDHVEVSLNLGELIGSTVSRANSASRRSTPRLHYVRGHSVRRAGKTFWRAAHFRGDNDRPILTRTVNVHGRRRG